MSGNKCNGNSPVHSTRISRLVRERELKKSNRVHPSCDGNDVNRGIEVPEHDAGNSVAEQNLEAAALALSEGWEKSEVRPTKQRLLVVANRLPVSALRSGKDSWSLDISAGGLVSALLGEFPPYIIWN